MRAQALILLALLSLSTPSQAQPPSVAALQQGRFDEAERLALEALTKGGSSQDHLVAAVCAYKRSMHDLASDILTMAMGSFRMILNQRYLTWSLTQADTALQGVEKHLIAAAQDKKVSLDLCLACWEVDWNRSGLVDERDRMIFEVELDSRGRPLPQGDPRRRPTFRFDYGDVFWAQSMVSFLRAALNLVMAYRLPQPGEVMAALDRRPGAPRVVVIALGDRARVHGARDMFLAGLDQADRARREYLAERDDEREWVPNPRQKDHPLPLPVDGRLYRTWKLVLSDLRLLVTGQEGLDVAALAQLGDHQWKNPPRGYIDVSRLLQDPGDLVLDLGHLESLERDRARAHVEQVLRDILGQKYVERMKPSLLTARVARMKREMERGEESLERKLRYLIWLN